MNVSRNELRDLGAVIVCGGHSQRMGRPKAWLPFGNHTLLERIVMRLMPRCQSIAVVAAAGQSLPDLQYLNEAQPSLTLQLVRDEKPDLGPLEGIRCGLQALEHLDAAFVTSCDAPLIALPFVEALLSLLEQQDAVVPVDDQFMHPLAAVYRPSVHHTMGRLLAEGERRPRRLFDEVATVRVPTESLKRVDPQLESLINLNHPDEYQAMLIRLGLTGSQTEPD